VSEQSQFVVGHEHGSRGISTVRICYQVMTSEDIIERGDLVCATVICIVCSLVSVLYKGYSESNLRWAVNKTSNEKKMLYTKNMYILKLLLNVVFVCLRQKVCSMWAQPRFDTFHQILITVEALWSQRGFSGSCSERDQGCKEGGQTTSSWNAPAVLKCEHLYADVHGHCHGEALHQMSAFYAVCSEWLTQYF
jgi:hypothetical protein